MELPERPLFHTGRTFGKMKALGTFFFVTVHIKLTFGAGAETVMVMVGGTAITMNGC